MPHPDSATRRHLLTLLHLGYVASDGKMFWLTPRVLRLGQAFIESSRLARLAQPFLQRVTAGTHEMAYLSALDGDDVVILPSLQDPAELAQRFPKGFNAVRPWLRLTPQPNR